MTITGRLKSTHNGGSAFAARDFAEWLPYYVLGYILIFAAALVPSLGAGWALARYVRRHGVWPHWLAGLIACALGPMLLVMGTGVAIVAGRGDFGLSLSARDLKDVIKLSATGILVALVARLGVVLCRLARATFEMVR